MLDLPDAPWIREAEMYGPDCPEDIKYSCPVCGEDEPEDFYFDQRGEIIGCNCCVHHRDAYEYMAQKKVEESVW